MRQTKTSLPTAVIILAPPVTLPRTRIKNDGKVILPRGVWSLATAGAPHRNQLHPRWIPIAVGPVFVEISGCTGIVNPRVGILYVGHITIIQPILIGKLAHSAYTDFGFGGTAFFYHKRVLAYAYCRKYAYDDYDDYKLYEGK